MIISKNKIELKKLIIILLFLNINIMAQQKGSFYFNSNENQEYSNNFLRIPDTSNNNDFRLLSSIILGYEWSNNILDGNFNIFYENRYLYYFRLIKYRRLENYISFNGSVKIDTNNILFLYNIANIRNYEEVNSDNYFRNIFNFYDQMNFFPRLLLLVGYKNWIKDYFNSSYFQNYLSNRMFLGLNYQLNNNDYIGVKFEYQYHSGNLYPVINLNNAIGDLSGSRFYGETYFNKLWGKSIMTDLSYKYESDQSNNSSNIQPQTNYQGDENIEDLLINDVDFDYLKNQLNLSLLINISDKFSLFSFNVVQLKNFNSWVVNTNEDLRKDILYYNSLMLKIKFTNYFRLNVFFNIENNNSNLPSAIYKSNKIGMGFQIEL